MTTTREVFFYNTEEDPKARTPYIINQEPIEYTCDGTEGSMTFDGYYYVEDHAPPYPEDDDLEQWNRPSRHSEWLPKNIIMYTKLRDTAPYKDEYDEEKMCTYTHYKTHEEGHYHIEIYKRVIHETTDRYSKEHDEDGEGMNICFFPTCKQTIYFRVVQKLT